MLLNVTPWTGTREQALRALRQTNNLPPDLTDDECLEVCRELGLPTDLPPAGYVWDGEEY